MNQLSNAFSLLNLDVADSHDEDQAEVTNGDTDRVTGEGKEKGGDGSPGEMKVREHKTRVQKLESVAGECKLPLVWIDLEMTGLNIEVDRILEIACIVTNGNLTKSMEGPDLVIHQAKECLDNMAPWCQEHHAASGLTEKVLKSTVTEEEAEKEVVEFVKRNIGTYTPSLAGNSVYVDFQFLKKYLPNLASLFSHVLVDVSSVKALYLRWYPRDGKKAPKKENKHRAMDDIKESIAELKYYKEHIFKASKSK
ncbi:oligoribonuclease-like isoform X3 [Solanum dulcamara]|uniref:oligoribonuclease-like isoform X2 n=1 Tax=Solanum dulcamara TaxID=45834 RepID=UPI002485C443|nr:oligoribonuclease-like isoform X2 [Solanum dulcamara]XP_055812909.1 oligoribonuclease-like isoform X2 [Solanum dulcamara]XP_055812910.1 oligoribonuclease-like isoform X3 [Solanum dulcamara]